MIYIEQPVLFLVGPTAIGKTALSIDIAKKYNCEIISMDSMQIYQHMDVGTAKITHEEKDGVVHHLLDVVPPDEHYDAALYCDDALIAIQNIHSMGKIPLITGGTGLYLQSLTQGFFDGPPGDEKVRSQLEHELESEGAEAMHQKLTTIDSISANKIHPNDSYRVIRALEVYRLTNIALSEHIRRQERVERFTNCLKIGLTAPREKLYERINLRTEIMLVQGLEQEVRKLLAMGYTRDLKSMGSIGYKHMVHYLEGEWDFEEMKTLLARDTRRYAKRQYTWFNKDKDIQWFDVKKEQKKIHNLIENWCV